MYTVKELEALGVPPERLEVRRLRLARGITQAALADLAGLPTNAVRRFELGDKRYSCCLPRLNRALEPSFIDYRTALVSVRKRNGWSYREAARVLGIASSTLSSIEKSTKPCFWLHKVTRQRLEALLASTHTSAA